MQENQQEVPEVQEEQVEDIATETQDQKPKEYTPEEIKIMKAKRTRFFQEELAHLKIQKEYYKLIAEIEESKARSADAQLKQVVIFMQMNPTSQEKEVDDRPDVEAPIITHVDAKEGTEESILEEGRVRRLLKK